MPLPTQIVELSQFGGLDSYNPDTDMDPHDFAAIQNVVTDEGGALSKRRGAAKVTINVGAGPVNMLYDLQIQAGINGVAADRIRTVIASGTTLYVVKLFNLGGQTIEATFSTSNALHYAVTDAAGACYISHEESAVAPKLLCNIAGTWRYVPSTLLAPAAAPVVSGTTGSHTGTYSAIYTYQDIYGNESNPSPESSGVNLAAQNLNVVVLASSDVTVSQINVYVLAPSLSNYHLSGTITNANGTFTHTISDSELLANDEAEYDHFPAPVGKYLAMYNDMLLIAGDPNVPDLVWASHPQFHRQFASAEDYARADSGDGQPIRGFGRAYDLAAIGKSDSLFSADGNSQTALSLRRIDGEYGVLGQPSMVFIGNRLVFFSDDGVYAHDTLKPEELTQKIRNTLRTLYSGNLAVVPPKQYSANYKYYKQLLFAVRETASAGENDTLLVYSYERGTWTRWKGNAPRVIGSVQNADDYEFLYGGDSAGNIWRYDPPNVSNNNDNQTGTITAIDSYAETPWINFAKLSGQPNWERARIIPRYLKIYAYGEPASGNSTFSLTVTYFVDFKTTVISTFHVTFDAFAWPTRRIQEQTINYGGAVGTYRWIKWRFEHNRLGEHFAIAKLVHGHRVKAAID